MLLRLLTKPTHLIAFIMLTVSVMAGSFNVYAIENAAVHAPETIDRLYLVEQQIGLLKERTQQSRQELTDLQSKHDSNKLIPAQDVSKSVVDKAALDISVVKSNLES